MKLRSTERRTIPFWEQIKTQLKVCDLQGLLIGTTKERLERAIQSESYDLRLTGVEAVQLDESEPLQIAAKVYEPEEWSFKLRFVKALGALLYLIAYKHDIFYICRAEKQTTGEFQTIHFFQETKLDPDGFARWWKDHKQTVQIKKVYEARSRQAQTNFDEVLESRGVAWGGNIDGVVFDKKENICAVVEIRFSNRESVTTYDPSRYFHGTRYKSGDYMTWLPLWYVAKTLNTPLLLLTLSAHSEGQCGVAIIANITKSGLVYKNYPPNQQVLNSSENVIKWLETKLKRELI